MHVRIGDDAIAEELFHRLIAWIPLVELGSLLIAPSLLYRSEEALRPILVRKSHQSRAVSPVEVHNMRNA